MKRVLIAAAVLSLGLTLPAVAASKSSGQVTAAAPAPLTIVHGAPRELTVLGAVNMLRAIRTLDSPHDVTVKQDGKDVTVKQTWTFGSGTFRMKIARNAAALATTEQDVEKARIGIVQELLKTAEPDKDGKKPTEILPTSPQYPELQKQFNDVLNAPAQVTGLMRIKASELKLDINEIPVEVLAALSPIIDDDLDGK